MLSHCRIVLVGAQFPGNIGATARVMRNFGLEELVLVRPECDHRERSAQQLSTQGEEILDRALVVDDLPEALADCVLVVGTSARVGGLFRRRPVGWPEALLPGVARTVHVGHRAALVFGPERTGLSNAETTLCHHLIQIPTAEAYPSLNLSHAVAICLYGLHRAALEIGAPVGSPPSDNAVEEQRALWQEQDRMFAQMQAALERIHFLYGEKAAPTMHALRHILGRVGLSAKEVNLLSGLARQIQWFADQGRV